MNTDEILNLNNIDEFTIFYEKHKLNFLKMVGRKFYTNSVFNFYKDDLLQDLYIKLYYKFLDNKFKNITYRSFISYGCYVFRTLIYNCLEKTNRKNELEKNYNLLNHENSYNEYLYKDVQNNMSNKDLTHLLKTGNFITYKERNKEKIRLKKNLKEKERKRLIREEKNKNGVGEISK